MKPLIAAAAMVLSIAESAGAAEPELQIARPGLSQRDRSLITVSALIAMNRPDQLRGHLVRARENGLSDAELVEATTHLAFYAGWPNAVTAIGVEREVFASPKP